MLSDGRMDDWEPLTLLQRNAVHLNIPCACEAEFGLPRLRLSCPGEVEFRVDVRFELFEERIRHLDSSVFVCRLTIPDDDLGASCPFSHNLYHC